jgi:hypothetical protein
LNAERFARAKLGDARSALMPNFAYLLSVECRTRTGIASVLLFSAPGWKPPAAPT